MAGKAKMIRIETISVVQVKIGMRIIFMPGARKLKIVTMKLNEAAMEATPRICRPSIQKSTLRPGFQAMLGQRCIAVPALSWAPH